MLRCVRWVFVGCLLLGSTSVAYGQDAAATACIDGETILPLLGGAGDSPVIPVTVNDAAAAMFVSPVFRHVFVHNHGAVWFPLGATQSLRAQDGGITFAEQTEIDNLTLGTVSLSMVPAMRLDGEAAQTVDGRAIVGMLGRDVLTNVEMLLDVPHKKLALFRWKASAACGDDLGRIFTGPVHTAEITNDGLINGVIHGVSVPLQLDPDLEMSVLPRGEAHAMGVSDAMLEQDPHQTTQYIGVALGFEHRFQDVQIGDAPASAFSFVVQDAITRGALGADFFKNSVVLFDFPHGRLLFQPSDDRNTQPVLHLHFDQSHHFTTAVHDTVGAVYR